MKVLIDMFPMSRDEKVECAAENHCLVMTEGYENCSRYCKKYRTLASAWWELCSMTSLAKEDE